VAATTLITGASGLIGGWTLRHWAGSRPVAVDHAKSDLMRPGTVTAVLDEARPDVVVHLAWSASGTPGYRESEDNALWLEATLELARLCRERDIGLFCTGTVVDETAEPLDRYTRSKSELRNALASDISSGTVTWLRPHYVFDPEAGRPALLADATAAAAAGRPVLLGSPDSEHDFVHAADVGRAVAQAVKHGLRGVVDIGSGRTRRVSQVVEALGVAWQPSAQPFAPTRTSPAIISALTATGWSASLTEEFFADV